MSATAISVGVVGATGAVGSTILEVLAERDFPAAELVPFASERSAGRRLAFGGGEVECRPLAAESIGGLDLVLSSAGGAISAEWAPRFVEAGAVVVDNTSYWRMHEDVPLVVTEVNPDAAEAPQRADREPELHDDGDGGRARRRSTARSGSSGSSSPPTSRSRAPAGSAIEELQRAVARGARRRGAARSRSSRTRSPSTSCRRSRRSRTATTTRPRSAR